MCTVTILITYVLDLSSTYTIKGRFIYIYVAAHASVLSHFISQLRTTMTLILSKEFLFQDFFQRHIHRTLYSIGHGSHSKYFIIICFSYIQCYLLDTSSIFDLLTLWFPSSGESMAELSGTITVFESRT